MTKDVMLRRWLKKHLVKSSLHLKGHTEALSQLHTLMYSWTFYFYSKAKDDFLENIFIHICFLLCMTEELSQLFMAKAFVTEKLHRKPTLYLFLWIFQQNSQLMIKHTFKIYLGYFICVFVKCKPKIFVMSKKSYSQCNCLNIRFYAVSRLFNVLKNKNKKKTV